MVSLKTHSKTKRTSVEWKRIHLPFGLSRYSAGAVDCNGRKQRKHQHKNEQRNALVIGFMLSLFLFWKLLLFAHDFFTFFHCGCSLTSRFCSPSIYCHHGYEVWTTEVRERWYEKNPKPTQLEPQFNSHGFVRCCCC